MYVDNFQGQFNNAIGELDHALSVMVQYGRIAKELSLANQQTLKHHAEDMILAGKKILSLLGFEEK